MKKQPERTEKTKRSLIDAFWKCAKNKGIDGVSISEITKVAGLNRGTFYVYFKDINDLIMQSEKEIISNFRFNIERLLPSIKNLDFAKGAENITNFLSGYDEKLFLLIGKNGDPYFISCLRSEAKDFFPRLFTNLEKSPYKDYITVCYSSAFIGLLTYWHDNGQKEPIGEIAAQIYKLLAYGIIGNEQEQ